MAPFPRIAPFLLLALLCATVAGAQSGGDYDITSSTAAAAGTNIMSGAAYTLAATAGQSAVDRTLGADYELFTGLWAGGQSTLAAPLPAPLAGQLDLAVVSANPVRSTATRIAFVLPVRTGVRLGLYSTTGRLVRMLVDGTCEAGRHEISWNGADRTGRGVPDGVYFLRLNAARQARSAKIVVLN